MVYPSWEPLVGWLLGVGCLEGLQRLQRDCHSRRVGVGERGGFWVASRLVDVGVAVCQELWMQARS